MNEPERRSRLLRLAGNSASLVASAVTIRASSFLLYVMVARYRGAFEFGQLSLATTVFAVLLELALVGVRRVVVRDVAARPERSRSLLTAGAVLTAGATVAATAAAWAFVTVMPYEPETSRIIVLVALALWPAALAQVTESIAQGWERAHLVLWVNGPVSIAKVAVAFVLLEAGGGVIAVAWVLVGGYALSAAATALLIAARSPAAPARPSWPAVRDLAAAGIPFLAINLTTSVRSNLGTLLVSGFLGETAVGLFNAANQLTVPVRLVYENLVLSFFPSMVRRFQAGAVPLRDLVGTLIAVLSSLTLPLIVALFVLARPILLLLYGEPEFGDAAVVLMITVWAPFLDTVKGILGHAMWASHRERAVLRVTLANLAISVTSGLILIPAFGLIGAAANVVVVSVANVIQHWAAARGPLGGIPLLRNLWRPLAATAAMGVVLYLASPLPVLAAAGVALAAYLLVLATLVVHAAGGIGAARSRWISPWFG